MINFGVYDQKALSGLKRHFRKVNQCLQSDFNRHEVLSFAVWKRRSELKWKVDWGPYKRAILDARQGRKLWHARRGTVGL